MSMSQGNLVKQRRQSSLESRLASYLAASSAAAASATFVASSAEAAVVGNTNVQAFGINQEVNIDFNSDGHVDFQIDHDRHNLNGTDLDYLQVDKNDASSGADPLPLESFETFPAPPGVAFNEDHEFLKAGTESASQTYLGSALTAGESIGLTPSGSRTWGFGESSNAYFTTGLYQRTNRLIDEDGGQIDANAGRTTTPAPAPSEWLGLGGEVRYVGTRIDLNNEGHLHYGWIGIRITNDADATGEVVGYAFETDPDTPILAGDAGPIVSDGDFDNDGDVDGADFLQWQTQLGSTVTPYSGADGDGNGSVNADDLALWKGEFSGATIAAQVSTAAVPEPGSLLMTSLGGALLLCWFVITRGRRKLALVAAGR